MDSIFSFAVDGNWTEWSNWAPCSESCGEATRTRKRYCTNPPPFHGEIVLVCGKMLKIVC